MKCLITKYAIIRQFQQYITSSISSRYESQQLHLRNRIPVVIIRETNVHFCWPGDRCSLKGIRWIEFPVENGLEYLLVRYSKPVEDLLLLLRADAVRPEEELQQIGLRNVS